MKGRLDHDVNLPDATVTVGLDLHGDDVIAALWRRAEHPARPSAFSSADIRSYAEKKNTLLACALPVTECVTRRMSIPLSSLSKAQKVLPGQLDVLLPFSLESCAYGFPLIQKKDQGTVEAVGVAATKESVTTARAFWSGRSFDPMVLDHEGLALWTQSRYESPAMEMLRVVVYLGSDRISFAVGTGERLLGAHGSRTGTSAFTPDETGRAAMQAWRDRLIRTVRPYQQEIGTDHVTLYWSGPTAAEWRLPCEALLNEQHAWSFYEHADARAFLARALARRAATPGALRWNFLEKDLLHPFVAAWRLRARAKIGWAAAVAGLGLCMANLLFAWGLDHMDRQAQSALTAQARRLSGLPNLPRGQEVLVASREMEEQAKRLQPLLRSFHDESATALKFLLAAAFESGVQFDAVTIRDDQIMAQGMAADWEPCERLLDRLKENGWEATLDRREALASDRVRFRLIAGRAL